MYGPDSSPIDPSKIIIIMIIAIICVMGITFALNGTTSTEPVENNTTEQPAKPTIDTQETVVGNSTLGTVTKITGYGNSSSNIRVALIVGVNQKTQTESAVISTLESLTDLKYSYDIYVVKASNETQANSDSNDTSNLTINNKTQSLAYEYAVPDIINNQYNFTMDVHGVNDSNSFVFVPSDDTFTSKKVVSYISNNTNVGRYLPNSYSYADYVSVPLISNNIPSMVYVTNEYSVDGTSQEISDVMHAVDGFDFEHLMDTNSTDTSNQTDNQADVSSDSYSQVYDKNGDNYTSKNDSNYSSANTRNNSEIVD